MMAGFAARVAGRGERPARSGGARRRGRQRRPRRPTQCSRSASRRGTPCRLEQRRQIRLLTLPMDDGDENAAMVNALQRHATDHRAEEPGRRVRSDRRRRHVEGQGRRGFGRGWHRRSGGSRDWRAARRSRATSTPSATRWCRCSSAPEEALRLGDNARRHVLEAFVGDEHLMHYGVLMERLKGALSEPVLSRLRVRRARPNEPARDLAGDDLEPAIRRRRCP